MSEGWLPVIGFEGFYEVSSLGRVRSLPRMATPGVILNQSDRGDAKGYLRASLSRHNRKSRKRVHTLVAKAFLGSRPAGLVLRHLDGDKHNNALSNLTYGTASENALDSVEHGTHHCASRTHCPYGHPYDTVNTYHYLQSRSGRPARGCRTCRARR